MSAAAKIQIELRDRIVEFRRVNRGEIQPNPRNFRKHPDGQRETMRQMLATIGVAGAALAYRSARAGGALIYIDGHLRDAEIPANLPVLITDLDDAEADTLLAGYDHLSAMAGQDDAMLAELLQSLSAEALPAAGYSDDDLKALLASVAEADRRANPKADAGPQIDRAAELQAKWQVERGQIWSVGRHRLMVGDSTDQEAVAGLMGGERAALMCTDPPYAVDYIEKARDMNERGYGHSRATLGAAIAGDELTDDECAVIWRASFAAAKLRALDGHAAWYVWHAPGRAMLTLYNLLKEIGLLHHQTIIWVKNNFVIGRCDYQWQHESCFYGWMKGSRPEFYGARNQTTIWEIDRDTNAPIHPTQKPVECFAIPTRNHLKGGEIVYDPFAGSGTAMVAAERNGARARCVEKSPLHAAVLLERMTDMGLEPKSL